MNVNNNQSVENIPDRFSKVFGELGCLKKPYHIEINPNVTPVVSPLQSIPIALRERLKLSLNDTEEKGNIEKVDDPTE